MDANEIVKEYKAGQRHFTRASLGYAALTGAILCEADLIRADLRGAILRGTHLGYANLTRAKLIAEQLDKALPPQGVTMPAGTEYP
jgi:uncharacterized protein YjbI with pentapeptide repeats